LECLPFTSFIKLKGTFSGLTSEKYPAPIGIKMYVKNADKLSYIFSQTN
jgi:hypothetical protein